MVCLKERSTPLFIGCATAEYDLRKACTSNGGAAASFARYFWHRISNILARSVTGRGLTLLCLRRDLESVKVLSSPPYQPASVFPNLYSASVNISPPFFDITRHHHYLRIYLRHTHIVSRHYTRVNRIRLFAAECGSPTAMCTL